MSSLHELQNALRPKKSVQRVGRGIGSGRGKTSCRGQKGAGARSGYKRRWGQEGGQLPLYRRLPTRGFSNARFARPAYFCCNLDDLHSWCEDGDVVDFEALVNLGYVRRSGCAGLKVLGRGVCTRKIVVKAHAVSAGAKQAMEQAGIKVEIVGQQAS